MSTKKIIICLAAFLILVASVSVLLASGRSPELKVGLDSTERFFDFGKIKVTDVKQKDFILTNSGTKPLQILNINSSCGCTTGQIIYNGQTSKEFGMHSQSGYVTEIDPNTSATVRVIYRPATMPVFGSVQREVYLTTNDSEKEKLVFAVKAYVGQ